jgi:hypothetical protein
MHSRIVIVLLSCLGVQLSVRHYKNFKNVGVRENIMGACEEKQHREYISSSWGLQTVAGISIAEVDRKGEFKLLVVTLKLARIVETNRASNVASFLCSRQKRVRNIPLEILIPYNSLATTIDCTI